MKFIIYNSACSGGYSDTLSEKYFRILSEHYNIKRVNQKRFNTIISLKSMNEILNIIKIVKHRIIIEDCLNPFMGIKIPVLHIYDDFIE